MTTLSWYIFMSYVTASCLSLGPEQRVSPYYFSLEDLKEDWAKMAAASKDQSVPKNPKVKCMQ